jgi:DNA modification methylase
MLELNKIYCMDCLEGLKQLPDNTVECVITDPPYGLSFMGKKWDYDVPSIEIWGECFRVLKPGGYLLAFAGTRTQHRMAVRIEDAGFEIRDMIAWVYGSGFPKSLNIGKAVDKLQGNEREVVGDNKYKSRRPNPMNGTSYVMNETKWDCTKNLIDTKGTSEWEGWGTALKPALEPITVARKPLSEKTVAENCLKWGTGGINIDECRVGTTGGETHKGGFQKEYVGDKVDYENHGVETDLTPKGRFPANLIHDGSDEVLHCFPDVDENELADKSKQQTIFGGLIEKQMINSSRFFYCAKASKDERNKGCEELEEKIKPLMGEFKNNPGRITPKSSPTPRANHHPTVKPIALMEYLIKLVSREGATVLDPFMGSGTTAVACKQRNRNFIGFEISEEYCKIAEARLKKVNDQKSIWGY